MDDATLTKCVGEILGGIPGWAWRLTGNAYTSDEVAGYYGAIRTEPDRAFGVRVYGWNDERDLSWRRAQVRYRGAPHRPDGADELASAGFAVLHGLSRVGGISDMRRQSASPLGTDQNGREERTDNYIIILDNPEAST